MLATTALTMDRKSLLTCVMKDTTVLVDLQNQILSTKHTEIYALVAIIAQKEVAPRSPVLLEHIYQLTEHLVCPTVCLAQRVRSVRDTVSLKSVGLVRKDSTALKERTHQHQLMVLLEIFVQLALSVKKASQLLNSVRMARMSIIRELHGAICALKDTTALMACFLYPAL